MFLPIFINLDPTLMPIDGSICSAGSAPSSASTSPKKRLKLLCSHGGKILPRPADAQLKYVGGETRVISLPRDIPFQEVMKRVSYLIDGEMMLKYQLAWEDLDSLVSVKSDEDVVHMFDEMEHYEMAGMRMRAFLFPKHKHKQLASASTSPRESITTIINESALQNNLHKIHTSPNNHLPQHASHCVQQCCHNSGHISPNPQRNTAPERLVSVGRRGDGMRIQVDTVPHYYYASRGSGCCTNHDNCGYFSDTKTGNFAMNSDSSSRSLLWPGLEWDVRAD